MTPPTTEQLAQLARLEDTYRRAVEAGSPDVVLQVRRKPKQDATSIRVAPGLTGRLVQWGDGTDRMPSVVFVKTAAMGRFLERCRQQVAAGDPAPEQPQDGEDGR